MANKNIAKASDRHPVLLVSGDRETIEQRRARLAKQRGETAPASETESAATDEASEGSESQSSAEETSAEQSTEHAPAKKAAKKSARKR